jgi:hypothetical protein
VYGLNSDLSYIAKLEISAQDHAHIHISNYSLDARKCRASSAKVLSLHTPSDNVRLRIKSARSSFDSDFVYRIGETVRPKDRAFDKRPKQVCAPGIHFFLTFDDAARYI